MIEVLYLFYFTFYKQFDVLVSVAFSFVVVVFELMCCLSVFSRLCVRFVRLCCFVSCCFVVLCAFAFLFAFKKTCYAHC